MKYSFIIAGLMAVGSALAGYAVAASEWSTEIQTEIRETPELLSVVEEDGEPEDWFSINPVDDEIFGRIYGNSYKKDCSIPREELRYLTVAHHNFNGEVVKGELICNALIAEDLIDIFRNLYNDKYPIERLVLIDEYGSDDIKSMQANNSSCFNYRVIAGSNKLSKHARGLAIDINPLYNPWVKQDNGVLKVSPEEGRPYADRKKEFPYKIDRDDLCYKEFIRHGFKWGGDWTTIKDYQHFEK